MSLLLPLSVTLPLSLPLLNTSTFTPESKNEDLHAGYLQLPAGCTVLVTESGVAEGKLIEKGVMQFTFLDYILLYCAPWDGDADWMFYDRYYEPQSSARRDELSITSLYIPIQPVLVSYRLRVRGFGRRQKKRFFPSTLHTISSCATVDMVLVSTDILTSTDEYHTPSPTAQKEVRR
jgi:Mini-chromosome maintenance replisome factor